MEEVKYIPGDLVTSKLVPANIVCRITAVDQERRFVGRKGRLVGVAGIEGFDVDSSRYVYRVIFFNEIIPIPLTSEILKKNGWKKYICISEIWYSDEVFIDGDKDDEKSYIYFELHHKGNCWDIFQRDELLRKGIKYVHQLQHLLFGLGLNHEIKV